MKAEPERTGNRRTLLVDQLTVKVAHKPSNKGVQLNQSKIATDASSRAIAELSES